MTLPGRLSLLLVLALVPAVIAFEDRPAIDLHGDTLPASAIARMGTVRLRHDCRTLAFAPDSKTFATGGTDHLVRIWDVASGKEALQLKGHTHHVSALSFSADGKQIISGDLFGNFRIWEAKDGKLLRTFGSGKHEQAALSLMIAPDAQTMTTVGVDRAVRVWDLTTGKERQKLIDEQAIQDHIVLSADGKHFAAVGKDRSVAVWDIANAKEVVRFRPPHKAISCLRFTPDSKALVLAGPEPLVALCDMRTGAEIRRFESTTGLFQIMAFSSNGRYLAAKSRRQQLHLWGVASGKELRALDLPLAGIGLLAFSPDGKVLVACQGQVIHLWDLAKNREMHELPGHAGAIDAVGFYADGKRLISTGRDATARVWESSSGKLLQTWQAPASLVPPLHLMPGGLVHVTDRRRMYQVDLTDGKTSERELISGLLGVTLCTALSADGKWMACRDRDPTIRLYRLETGKEVVRLEEHRGHYHSYTFSPDGKLIAGCGINVPVVVWDTATGKALRSFKVTSRNGPFTISDVFSVAFTPDGKGLLTLSIETALWEVATGRERWRIGWPNTSVFHARVASDGRMAALGTHSGAVVLVETGAGIEVGRFEGHRGAVRTLAFAPDGKVLASGSEDGTAVVWDTMTASRKAIPAVVELRPEQLVGLWKDLSSADAALAYKAMRMLIATPQQSVPLLQERLQGASKREAERFAQLLRQLDDKAFAVREAAQTELEKWSEAPMSLLRKESENHESVEVRNRLQRALKRRNDPNPEVERQRGARGVEILEFIRTAAARQALKILAEKGTDATLRREALSSLERLKGS